jgi:hypothetical protein
VRLGIQAPQGIPILRQELTAVANDQCRLAGKDQDDRHQPNQPGSHHSR